MSNPRKTPAAKGSSGTGSSLPAPHRRRVLMAVMFGLALLTFLALLSFNIEDVDHLAGGLATHSVYRNWIGYVGAWWSRWLFQAFGFAAYVLALLLLSCFGRRLFGHSGIRSAGWDYWTAIGLIVLGASMLFGIWPNCAAPLAAHLNISQTPGGVLGQRLCAPDNGWMRILLNPTGSALVATIVIAIGLLVLWLHDWHDLSISWRQLSSASDAGKAVAATSAAAGSVGVDRQRQEKAAAFLRNPEAAEEAAGRGAGRSDAAANAAVKPRAAAPASTTPGKGAAPTKAPAANKAAGYLLPPLDILHPAEGGVSAEDPKEIENRRQILQATLDSFGIDAQVGDATSGPRVTLFEVNPAPGVKVERISRISNNIAMELGAVSLRILTPIPGRKSVGIEVPNANPQIVAFHTLLSSPEWKKSKARIPLALGRDISGEVVILDLAGAPHLLIAGATGSGKSVCLNAMIMSLIYNFTPEQLRLIMVDPKVVEFACYSTLPHLTVPVISDAKKVPLALRWTINEMERRYRVLAKVGARNLLGFNNRPPSKEIVLDDSGEPIPAKLPYIVLIIDELADIMMTAKTDVETSLARIAQLSRAVGIHTIVATQRPSVNVITGTIKANFPTRIAFQVTSQIDSRTILDTKGAEMLLGRGDMLFKPPGASQLQRNQSALVEDDEIEKAVAFVSNQAEQQFDPNVFRCIESGGAGGGGGAGESGGGADIAGDGMDELSDAEEELIERAIDVILRDRRATTSYVQRCLRIGYNRAATIMEILEQRGVIGPQIGTAPREILIAGSGNSANVDDDDFADDEQQQF